MTAFTAVAQYYHLLFPARPAQLKFLTALIGPPPARVFDIASGTGEYTAELHRLGYDCFGIDLDLAMHARAKARHPKLAVRERLLQGDMLELTDLVRGPAQLAFCIGGSLAALKDDAQVREALRQMWDLTRPAGAVAVQLVNYDRVLAEASAAGETHWAGMPEIRAGLPDGGELKFTRSYDLSPVPDSVRFTTRLEHPGGVAKDTSTLLCLTRARLEALLPAQAQVQWYGDYSAAPWAAAAAATIAVLR